MESIDHHFEDLGHQVRRPATLRRWMRAYAAATATSASLGTIRDAATSDRGEKPTRVTTLPYRDVLERLWILDPVPHGYPAATDSRASHHHPSTTSPIPRSPHACSASTPTRCCTHAQREPPYPATGPSSARSSNRWSPRVYAQASEALIAHLRTWSGDREVDLIVERGRQILALEVKLGQVVDDRDVRHLIWLRNELGDDLNDAAVITT